MEQHHQHVLDRMILYSLSMLQSTGSMDETARPRKMGDEYTITLFYLFLILVEILVPVGTSIRSTIKNLKILTVHHVVLVVGATITCSQYHSSSR